ncbi:sigma factor-like helix-turn-helix DNA-binding protein [Demequina maris]|uniref:sigma factor-like helix-turn-helix DNA-binding protein n=1 Tax=Demequina maris TaxID=1638982 RepID=UPI000A95F856|nr:sigma factor-like helix-turn-helix DNA-binding protein [Demequina maris]
MDGTLAGLSEGARARLGADAYLLEGDADAAERLLREAAVHALTTRGAGPVESRTRAAMAELHVHRARRHRHRVTPAAGFARALRGLAPRQRAATVLYFVDGLSAGDIAAALGIPEATASAAVRDGTLALGRALGVEGGADGGDETFELAEIVEISARRSRTRGAP